MYSTNCPHAGMKLMTLNTDDRYFVTDQSHGTANLFGFNVYSFMHIFLCIMYFVVP